MDLYRWTEKFQYVSFDVFDTLIWRSVARPSDLFALMETMGAPSGFAQKRREAERRAGERLHRPVTLDEIYAELRANGDDWPAAKAMEIDLEQSGCVANPVGASLFHRCIDAGKTVVLVSDMYLPAAIITAMLNKCGLRGYKKLYVSCEYGVRKAKGKLFKIVLDELKIRPKQLIHIGDNPKADVISPTLAGVYTRWLPNAQKRICRVPKEASPEEAVMYRTIQACVRNASVNLGKVERQGCAVFGPLLYGFTVWLAKALQKDGIHDVYFLAREGLIMKRAFDELQIPNIKTQYLYCSRRALTIPVLWKHPDFEDAYSLICHTTKITLREFIARVGLEAEDYERLAADYHLQLDKKYFSEEFIGTEQVRNFYETIRENIYKNSQKEYKAALQYIESLHMEKSVAFVDIGDYGTVQAAFLDLAATTSWDIQVRGYYIGVSRKASNFVDKGLSGAGYLYDPTSKGKKIEEERKYFVTVYEALFMATHGSVKRYVVKDGKSVPEFCASEYKENEGKIIDEFQYIQSIQDGGMALVRYMLKAFSGKVVPLPAEAAFAELRRMGLAPELAEAEGWGNFRFVNYGQKRWFAVPKNIGYYILRPKQLMKDLTLSTWRIGFMKRLLRFPLPYAKMAEVLQQVADHRNKTMEGTVRSK